MGSEVADYGLASLDTPDGYRASKSSPSFSICTPPYLAGYAVDLRMGHPSFGLGG